MMRAERIYLEAEENGWELVVEVDEAPPRGLPATFRFNVHGIASSSELEAQLGGMLLNLNDWKAGR